MNHRIAAVLVLVSLAAPARWASAQTFPRAPHSIRAMSYNIEQGMGHEGRTIGGENFRVPLFGWHIHVPAVPEPLAFGDHYLDLMVGDVRAQDPDVVVMQEVDARCIATLGYDDGAHMAKALKMHMVFEVSTTNGPGGIAKVQGNAVLSRFPIDSHRVVVLNERVGQYERRIAVLAHVLHPDFLHGVWVVSVHMSPGDWAAVGQEELTNLTNALVGLEGPVILGGDFNAHPGDRAITALAEMTQAHQRPFTDCFVEAGVGAGLTSGYPHPLVRGDFLYHSPELQTNHCWVPDNHQHSNHAPVVAELVLAAPTTVAAAPAGVGVPGGQAVSLLGVGGQQ